MRVTISKPGVYSPYGIAWPVGSVQIADEGYGRSLISSLRATDTDGALTAPPAKPFATTPVFGQVFVPASTSTPDIIAAAVAASAIGGIVQLPGQIITLTSPLPLLPGITYQGCGYNLSPAGGPQLTGGTVLQGDGTFPCFAGNATDLAAPYGSSAALLASWICCTEIAFLGINNFTYGVKLGALYQGGTQWGYFHDMYITNCNQWGMWVENSAQCSFERISTAFCGGGLAFIGSGQALWNFGNSHFSKCTLSGNQNGSGRGLWVAGRAGSQLNNVNMFDMATGGATVTNTQAATMANASTAIGVTDLSRYGIGMPVKFSGTANGFTLNQIYFVTSLSAASGAGNITVANFMGGTGGSTPLAATGATAVNIVTQGWPVLEVGGSDAGSSVTFSSIVGATDAELGGTAHIVLQALLGFTMDTGIVHVPGSTADICCRNMTAGQGIRINIQNTGVVTDFDSTCQKIQVHGSNTTPFSANYAGIGFTSDGTSGFGRLNLVGTSTPDFAANSNFFNQIQMGNCLALKFSQQPTGHTLVTADGNLITFQTGAGGTLTLPALTTNMAGWSYIISNPQANTLTVSSAAQNIIFAGASGLSTTLLTLTHAHLIAMNNAGTMYWARVA
jgi:hypothetical protein